MPDGGTLHVIGPFRGPRWLPGGHAQTIYPYFLARPVIDYRRERIDTHDGDFWDFDWLVEAPGVAADAPLVVLFHGLEGNARSHYSLLLMQHLAARRWRGVVPHFRGCGGMPNLRPRAYHSGDHEEVGAMLAALRARVDPRTPVYAVGVSLGGSALLNWIGREGAEAQRTLVAAAVASVPLDLMAAGIAIGQGLNRVYTRFFLQSLKPKALSMAGRFPELLDAARIARVRTMWDFDDAVTAPLHGFAGTDRLLDARIVQTVARARGVAHARGERAQRSLCAGRVAAFRFGRGARRRARTAGNRWPRGLHERPGPRPHRLVAPTRARILRPRSMTAPGGRSCES